jgi:hypothetical protein
MSLPTGTGPTGTGPTGTGPSDSGLIPAPLIYSGYADADAPAHRGWVLGHFMPPGDPRQSSDIEIKWGVHPCGDKREHWVTAESRNAAIFLISGRFRVDLPDRSVVLDRPGAYIVFGGVSHSWEAEDDSITICVRWPSVPGY